MKQNLHVQILFIYVFQRKSKKESIFFLYSYLLFLPIFAAGIISLPK